MDLSEYRPKSELVVAEHEVRRARYPAIDVHSHLARGGDRIPSAAELSSLVEIMDDCNIQTIVDLNHAFNGSVLRDIAEAYAAFPGRFLAFGGVDLSSIGTAGFSERAAREVEQAAELGAAGLKFFKELGLRVRDAEGKLVMPDDPRLQPIWETAGRLGLPVLIHVADPVAFFRPVGLENERYEELIRHPNWSFHGPEYPEHQDLINCQRRLAAENPRTNFIFAHVASYPENLAWVAEFLDDCPNAYVDISARFAEIGRQPFTARDFFVKYQDRILYGTDARPSRSMYRITFRILETRDEYFPYSTADIPPQGRWNVYGLDLPDEVLGKVYRDNALRLLRVDA